MLYQRVSVEGPGYHQIRYVGHVTHPPEPPVFYPAANDLFASSMGSQFHAHWEAVHQAHTAQSIGCLAETRLDDAYPLARGP